MMILMLKFFQEPDLIDKKYKKQALKNKDLF